MAEPTVEETPRHRAYRFTLGAVRLALGWVFLWAFLGHATTGPLAGFYQSLAGAAWADWLFMIGLAGIGIALMLGITVRIVASAGALLVVLMWSAALPPTSNPFMDDHLIYAGVLIVIALAGAGRTLGFGRVWERIPLIIRYGALK
ncbi:MAG: hypothetical protein DLM59_17750 [Pseudonocardiales bacterium]|nr:MAG: hypothetical protein DLM59_17750 [Pseudonocardiales bacterium]